MGGLFLALVALILPLGGGAQGSTNVGSLLPDAGHLTLGFDSVGTSFRYFPAGQPVTGAPASVGGLEQKLTTSGCEAKLASTASLVTLAPAITGKPASQVSVGATSGQSNSFVGLGVRPKSGSGSTGTSCGRIDGPSESLTIRLGTDLSQTLVDRAELDIDAKYGVTIQAKLFIGGPTGTQQGPTLTFPTTGGSDSGPDCGGCDNWGIPISGAFFDTIVLTPIATANGSAFSLQGGAGDPCGTGNAHCSVDGLRKALGTRQSVFHLVHVTGTLNCGETSPEITGDGIATTVTRLSNADCQVVPYSLETDPDKVNFGKDLGTQSSAQFVLNITWDPEPPADPPGDTHSTQITYDGTSYHLVRWCLGVSYDSGGNVTAATLPGDEFYCLVRHNEHVLSDGQISISEQFYGLGDPGLKR